MMTRLGSAIIAYNTHYSEMSIWRYSRSSANIYSHYVQSCGLAQVEAEGMQGAFCVTPCLLIVAVSACHFKSCSHAEV
jgi:hypothetical protein